MADLSADEVLAGLGIEVEPAKVSSLSAFQERVISGFEDINRFYEENKRPPFNSEGLDIFERLYAVRLAQLRKLPEAVAVLASYDTHKLLNMPDSSPDIDSLSEDALLAALGAEPGTSVDEADITALRHVRSTAERREAEEIANRAPCKDFKEFKPLFEKAERELKSGERSALRFGRDASIQLHDFFILEGQFVYVAEVGETIKMDSGHNDARLRLIFGNGTESNLLMRSLSKALWKDETGRRITAADLGPLFSDHHEQDDIETGTIYVLRSKSTHPYVSEHRELIHKIGVTGGKVETRISGADKEATYLLADVEVVATYKLHNINRVKMENLFHKIFNGAQIDITIEDRFGNLVKPREWFLVPLHVIDEVVGHFTAGTITEVLYDTKLAALKTVSSK